MDNSQFVNLISQLTDKTKSVRQNAAASLVKIGAPAIPALVEALKDANLNVRREAFKVLGRIVGVNAVPALIAESFRSTILTHCSNVEVAHNAIDRYFSPEKFTGSQFERLADSQKPNEFTAQDIVAVSMLGVNIPAPVSVWLLVGEGAHGTRESLSQAPTDLDIWNAAEHLLPDKPL